MVGQLPSGTYRNCVPGDPLFHGVLATFVSDILASLFPRCHERAVLWRRCVVKGRVVEARSKRMRRGIQIKRMDEDEYE